MVYGPSRPITHRPVYAPGKIIVSFADNVSEKDAVAVIEGKGLTVCGISDIGGNWMSTVGVPVDEEEKWIAVLLDDPKVSVAERIAYRYPM